jgi:processive 1,2-diacylglycerol beta-glucosyltransferase
MKKILIIYATAGIGHAKAAFAVKKAFDELKPSGVEAKLVDSLDYMTSYFRKSYLNYYLLMITRLANLWGLFYFLTNNFYVDILVSRARRYMNWLHSRRFVRFLRGYDPDVVVSTHFLANEIISNLKGKGLLKTRLITVVTDYRLHSFWVAKHVDQYVVGSQEAIKDLKAFGVGPSRVKLLGIPVEPDFTRKGNREEMSVKLGLEKGRLTILVVGGGFGIGPIENIVRALKEINGNIQVMVVAGYNEAVRRKIESLKADFGSPLIVYGFVNNMYDLMQAADCLVSKSGGLTATEALVKNLPMVIISPIPGQESRNSDFVVSHGAAVKVKNFIELKGVLRRLVTGPDELRNMRRAIEKIARPNSAYDIAKLAVEL